MPDVKCPMCSKPNPQDAEECEFCGARIKPLIIQQAPEEPRAPRLEQTPAGAGDEEAIAPQEEPAVSDWLSHFRDEIESEGEPAAQVEREEGPGFSDMLGRLRIFGGANDEEQEPPQPKEPPAVAPAQESERQAAAPEPMPEVTIEPDAEPAPEPPSQSQPFVLEEPPNKEGQDEDIPGWLARVRIKKAHDDQAQDEPLEQTDWLAKLRESQPASALETIEVSRDMIPSEEPTPPFSPPEEDSTSDAQDQGEDDLFSRLLDEDEPLFTLDDLFADYEAIDSEEDQGGSELFTGVEAGAVPDGGKSAEEELFERLESEIGSQEFTAEALEQLPTESALPEAWEQLEEEPIDQALAEADEQLLADSAQSLDEDLFGGDIPPGDAEPVPPDLGRPEEQQGLPQQQPPFDSGQELEEWEDVDSQLLADLDRELESFEDEGETILPPQAEADNLLTSLPVLEPGESDVAQSDQPADVGRELPLQEEPREFAPPFTGMPASDHEPDAKVEAVDAQEGELPHVPALVIDDFGEEVSFDDDSFGEIVPDLAQGEVPGWLQELKSDTDLDAQDLVEGPEEEVIELVPATLPDWLESMRPIQTFQSVSEVHETEKDIVEAAGPLAGLKGVLIAEPVVAMPRSPTRTRSSLDIRDDHLQQAQILQCLIEREAEGVKAEEGKRPVAVLRWIVAVVMLAAVILPVVFGTPSFGVPENGPRDLAQFLDLTRLLPASDPVLLVFDYETAYAAEMEAMAGALMHHMMLRGQPLIAMSTQPSGPYLADRLFRHVGASHDASNGSDFVNLGYLAGGPTAVQLFASAPRETVMTSFRPEEGNEDLLGWETGPAREVKQLSDFAMVVVLTAGSENSRMWAEQAFVYLGDTPLVMLVSAGAEPMIRPYYEGRNPSVSAVLSGLGTAVKYEDEIGYPGAAVERWDAYGLGVLAAAFILIVGAARGMVDLLPRLGKSKSSGGEE